MSNSLLHAVVWSGQACTSFMHSLVTAMSLYKCCCSLIMLPYGHLSPLVLSDPSSEIISETWGEWYGTFSFRAKHSASYSFYLEQLWISALSILSSLFLRSPKVQVFRLIIQHLYREDIENFS